MHFRDDIEFGGQEKQMMKRLGHLFVCVMILLGMSAGTVKFVLAQSQAATATLAGQVSDSSGAIISGANVEILDMETGAKRDGVVDSAGLYTLTNLPHGTY